MFPEKGKITDEKGKNDVVGQDNPDVALSLKIDFSKKLASIIQEKSGGNFLKSKYVQAFKRVANNFRNQVMRGE